MHAYAPAAHTQPASASPAPAASSESSEEPVNQVMIWDETASLLASTTVRKGGVGRRGGGGRGGEVVMEKLMAAVSGPDGLMGTM